MAEEEDEDGDDVREQDSDEELGGSEDDNATARAMGDGKDQGKRMGMSLRKRDSKRQRR